MINFRLKYGEAIFEAEIDGNKEERYITVEQAEELALMLLEWVCFKIKEPKVVMAGTKYIEEEK
jgi:hypothetical protein